MVSNKNLSIKDMRTYIEDSYPIAYGKARKELGPNLVIVDQKDIKQGGFFGFFAKKKVKITFAVEKMNATPKKKRNEFINKSDQEELLKYLDKMGYSTNKISKKNNSENNEENIDTGVYNPYKKSNDKLKEEIGNEILKKANKNEPPKQEKKRETANIDINEIRESLKKDLKEEFKKEFFKGGIETKSEDTNKEFWDKLRRDDISEDVIDNIKYNFKENSIENDNYLEGLKSYFLNKVKTTGELEKKYLMLVGPTGVGKTTSGAKLAGTYWKEKNENVAFITSDIYRIGASDQLKQYGDIMKVPTEVVNTPEELKPALQKFNNKSFVILDTAGLNPKDKTKMEDLKEYVNQKGEGVDIALVLSSNSKLDFLINTIENFKSINIQSIIFTKIDETTSIGSLLTIMHKYEYPLSYVTTGQSVPDDIELANKNYLWEKFVEGLK